MEEGKSNGKGGPIRLKKSDKSWSEFRITSMFPERRSHMCSCIYLGKLYIYGGIDIQEGTRDSLYVIETESGAPEWTKLDITGSPIGKYSNGASVLVGTKWYIIGGNVNNDQSADVFIIDINTLICEKKPAKTAKGATPIPMDTHTAVLVNKTKMLVFGGYTGAKRSDLLQEYDIASNSWRIIKSAEGARKPSPRAGHAAVSIGSVMYIFGGSGEDAERKNDLWKYDANSEIWTEIKKKDTAAIWPQARAGHSAILADDKMYIFGGNLGLTLETNDLLAFDFKTSTWILVNSAGKLLDAEDKMKGAHDKKLQESPKKKYSPENSPKPKMKRNPELTKMETSPKKRSPEISPSKTMKGPSDSIDYDKQREEIKTPIVVAMNNSVVMKATFSSKKKAGYEIDEVVEKGRVQGNFPCGRDGYAMQVWNKNIYIFGGDRFQMAYNDLYSYSL